MVGYSYVAERVSWDIYDDFTLKKNPLIAMVYIKIVQRLWLNIRTKMRARCIILIYNLDGNSPARGGSRIKKKALVDLILKQGFSVVFLVRGHHSISGGGGGGGGGLEYS